MPRARMRMLFFSIGNLDEAHAHALHSVLKRHASGHDLAGILAEDEPPSKSAAHRRTIVWSALPEILSACGIEQHVHLSEDCELSVSGREAGGAGEIVVSAFGDVN